MKKNCKVLPMSFPPCETYQGMAFIMGLVLSYDNIKNYFYNSYIKIRCADLGRMKGLTLELYRILWDPLNEDGVLEVDRYNSNVIAKEYYIEFLKNRIQQENYILLFQVDEFYLSYSQNYKKMHFIHDVYIYGYEDEEFCIMAYKDGKLKLFNVDQREIRDAFYSCRDHCEGDVEFCTCKPWKLADITVDYDKIKSSLKDYYVGCSKENYAYGILVYQAIVRALKNMENNNNRDKIDLRVFRMLWEHKYLIKKHLEIINDKIKIEEAIRCAEEVEKIGKNVFRLAIKYSLSESDSILNNLIDKIVLMEKKEKGYLSKLVNNLG